MRVSDIRRSLETFGPVSTASDLALRAINRIVFFKILKGVVIEKVDPRFLAYDERYRFARLDERALRAFAVTPEYELSETFLREAFARGDECYGFLDGAILAAYGWYARGPTPLEKPGLVLRFSERYVYMYKGFTHPAHRGRRLHAIGMTRALAACQARGYLGIVSYVEATNFASLRSVYRMGYADFGAIALLGLGGRFLMHASAGCQPYDFRVEQTRSVPGAGRNPSRPAPGTTTASARPT